MQLSLISPYVQDSYRRFSGAERHKRLLHISNSVRNAKVVRLSLLRWA